jgi:membrane-associated phospholipid phosphatase
MFYALTDFGDLAVQLPVATLVLVWLFIARSRSAGLWWLYALGLIIAITAIFKVYFFSCPIAGGLRSPSGHTGLSVLVYGGVAVIFAMERIAKWERIVIGLTGIGLAASIGISRILLGKHSVVEVLVGFLFGLSSLAVFCFGYGRSAKNRGALLPLVVVIIAALALLHGREFSLEQLFQFLSTRLQVRALACNARY